MDWSNKTTHEFLALYENEPALWNTSAPEHKNRNHVYKAWIRIKNNLKDGTIPVSELKKKKEMLMSTYRKLTKKVRNSMETASKAEYIYKPEWPFYKTIAKFLDDVYKPRPKKTTEEDDLTEDSPLNPIRITSTRSINFKEENEDSNSSQQDGWVCMSEQVLIPEEGSRSSKRNISSEDEQPPPPSERRSKRSRKESDHSCLDQSIDTCLTSSFLKTIAGNLEKLTRQKDDHFESFGRYVASALRAMPPQQALALQPRIFSLITTGLAGGEGAVSQSDDG